MTEDTQAKGSVLPITVVVLALNEARNIEACVQSVYGWVEAVLVVDSGSTDDTVARATACGATVVSHPFETHARQWQWALRSLPVRSPWVLALDADQRVTAELRASMGRAFQQGPPGDVQGYFLCRRQVFRGRWIRHGGYYPKYLLKLFRRDVVQLDEQELVDHHFLVTGAVAKLAGDLVEDNRNEAAIAAWTEKHNRYAVLQARQEWEERRRPRGREGRALLGTPDDRVRYLKSLWARLPLFVRPCLYVFYRYVLRLGFLDGREGFVFHVLHGFWYRLLVDINIWELRSADAGDHRAGRA